MRYLGNRAGEYKVIHDYCKEEECIHIGIPCIKCECLVTIEEARIRKHDQNL
jgi:hypothetical protein